MAPKTPASVDPSKAAVETPKPDAGTDGEPTSNINQFDHQTYLLDWFIENHTSVGGQRKVACDQVVASSTKLIAKAVKESQTSAQSFVQDLTPYEYAQLVPTIQLALVDTETDAQTPIPLTMEYNIEKSIQESKKGLFYAGNLIGLKSLNMEIDGNTNTFSGKIYNVTLTLVFDSINTFFNTIPGLQSKNIISYADVFRGYGAAGGAACLFKTKLSIGWSAAPGSGLIKKYSLDSPLMTYSAYLHFIKSDISMKEDLSTEVKVKYQGFEEALFSNNEVFNFLNPISTEVGVDNMFADADTKEKEGKSDKITTDIQAMEKLLKAKLAALASADLNSAEYFHLNEKQLKDLWFGQGWDENVKMQETIAKELGDDFNADLIVKTQGMDDVNKSAYYAREIAKAYTKTYLTTGEFPKAGSTTQQKKMEQMIKQQANAIESWSDLQTEIRDMKTKLKTKKIEKEQLKSEIQAIDSKRKASNVGTVLQEAIFKHDVAREVKISAEGVQAYITGLQSKNRKDYFNKPSPAGGAMFPPPASGATYKAITEDKPGDSSGEQERQKALDSMKQKLAREQKFILSQADIIADMEKEMIVKQQESNAAIIAATTGEGSWTDADIMTSWTESHRKKVDNAKAALTKAQGDIKSLEDQIPVLEANVKANSTVAETGWSKTKIEEEISSHQSIQYILLGDLLSLVLNRLYDYHNSMTGGRVKEQMKKTVLMLSEAGLHQLTSDKIYKISLYDIPISVPLLMKFFTDRLIATGRSSMTVMQVFEGMIEIITKAQQRKLLLLKLSNAKNAFSAQFLTFPIEIVNGAPVISTKADNAEGVKSGIFFYTKGDSKDYNALMGQPDANFSNNISHFYLGGPPKGAAKSIAVSETDRPAMKLAAYEKSLDAINGKKMSTVPIFFSTKVKLVGCPIFHLGHDFYLATPSIQIQESKKHWFFLEGYYAVTKLLHSYTAGGHYETQIEGILQVSKSMIKANAHSAPPASASETIPGDTDPSGTGLPPAPDDIGMSMDPDRSNRPAPGTGIGAGAKGMGGVLAGAMVVLDPAAAEEKQKRQEKNVKIISDKANAGSILKGAGVITTSSQPAPEEESPAGEAGKEVSEKSESEKSESEKKSGKKSYAGPMLAPWMKQLKTIPPK